MTGIHLRVTIESDWPGILRVANEALPGAADGNAEWLANRRAFVGTGRARRHYVALGPDGRIVGYGAIEEDTGARGAIACSS